ncbi:hypothetical protein ACLB2K_072108 [Fragaria x ananassa]
MASRVGTDIKRRRSRRDWTEIPYDITASILSRLDGDTESLAAAEMVCKTWREICKDPKLWRTIDFHSNQTIYMLGPPRRFDIVKMCRATPYTVVPVALSMSTSTIFVRMSCSNISLANRFVT